MTATPARLGGLVLAVSLMLIVAGGASSEPILLLLGGSVPWVVLALAGRRSVASLIWFGFAGIALQATTLPAGLSPNLQGLEVTLRVADLLTIGGAGCLLFSSAPPAIARFKRTLVATSSVVLTLGLGIGVMRGNFPDLIVREFVLQLRFVSAIVVTLYALASAPRRVLHIVIASIWISGLVLLANLVTGLELDGYAKVVDSIASQSAASDTGLIRYQVAGSMTALFFLAGVAALALSGASLSFTVRVTALPALLTTALGFSRHSIVAIAVAALAGLVLGPSVHTVKGILRSVGWGGAAALGVALLLVLAPSSTLSNRLTDFGDAFGARVVAGLRQSGRSDDSSLALRNVESGYAIDAFERNPIFGGGFGDQYRPPINFGSGDFWRVYGRTYVHDAFLWIAVKLGLLGLLAYGYLMLRAMRRPDRGSRHPANVASVAALCSALVISIWVPLLLDPRGGVAMAGGLVATAAWSRWFGAAQSVGLASQETSTLGQPGNQRATARRD